MTEFIDDPAAAVVALDPLPIPSRRRPMTTTPSNHTAKPRSIELVSGGAR